MHVDEQWNYFEDLPMNIALELRSKRKEEYIEKESLHTDQLTRGWLLDQMINNLFLPKESKAIRYGEFFGCYRWIR